MSKLTDWMDRKLYPGYVGNWDNELMRSEILSRLLASDRVLDLGAGAGIVRALRFRGLAARVCGVDLDRRVLSNPHLDEARVAAAEAIPYPDSSFEIVFAANVLEHLEHPEQVLREVARVLRPGGRFIAKTPNRWHYVSLIARMTPPAFHRSFNARRGRDESDTFPTRYRINTPGRLRKFAARAGLQVESIRLVDGRPEYLRMWAPTYALGWAYERLVTRVPGLSHFRVVLLAVLRRAPVASP